MTAGSLNDLLHKQKVQLSLPQTIHIATDVAMGCHYLHKQKPMIIHRDLKSQNVRYPPLIYMIDRERQTEPERAMHIERGA